MKRLLLFFAICCIWLPSCKKQSETEAQYNDVFTDEVGTSELKSSKIKSMLVGYWELDWQHGSTTYYDKDGKIVYVSTNPNAANNYYQFASFPTYIQATISTTRAFEPNSLNKLDQQHLKVISGSTYLYINSSNNSQPNDYKQFWKFESVTSDKIVASMSNDVFQRIQIPSGQILSVASLYTKVTWHKYNP